MEKYRNWKKIYEIRNSRKITIFILVKKSQIDDKNFLKSIKNITLSKLLFYLVFNILYRLRPIRYFFLKNRLIALADFDILCRVNEFKNLKGQKAWSCLWTAEI